MSQVALISPLGISAAEGSSGDTRRPSRRFACITRRRHLGRSRSNSLLLTTVAVAQIALSGCDNDRCHSARQVFDAAKSARRWAKGLEPRRRPRYDGVSRISRKFAEEVDLQVNDLWTIAARLLRAFPFRLTGWGVSAMLPATNKGSRTFMGGTTMNAIATKFQVAAAAAVVAAGAAFVPVAANAAPAVDIPAAPVSHVIGDLAQQPNGLFGVFSVQFTGVVTRTSTYFTRFTILNYQSKLEANPDSPFASFYQRRINQLNAQLARYGQVNVSACFGGRSTSIVAGSYGAVTTGTCTT